ncbi:hypothetical protein PSHT_04070, partial [Puccinia striiformis]
HVSCSPGQTNVAQKYNGLLKQLANLQINFVNLSPIDFKCQLAKTANIHHHDFIRTPEPCHRLAAQHLWSTLSENSHIHKGKYLGWYSVSDETYYSTNQVQKNQILPLELQQWYSFFTNSLFFAVVFKIRLMYNIVIIILCWVMIQISIETNKTVEWIEEENYMFRLMDRNKPNSVAHGHRKIDSEIKSKSIENVIDPFEAIEEWGVDGVQYYLMRAPGSLWGDSDWAPHRLDENYWKDFLGQLGNLLARISALKLRSAASILFPSSYQTQLQGSDSLQKFLCHLPNSKSIEINFDVLAGANQSIPDRAPWHNSTSPEDAHQVLHLSAKTLRIASILLQPFIPSKAAQLLDSLGVGLEHRSWAHLGLVLGTGSVVCEGRGGLLFPQLLRSLK